MTMDMIVKSDEQGVQKVRAVYTRLDLIVFFAGALAIAILGGWLSIKIAQKV